MNAPKASMTAVRAIIRDFAADAQGGVATMFGLAVVPLTIVSLVTLDYSRASNAKQALQESLDAATLMAARSTAVTAEDIDTIGDRALAAEMASEKSTTGLKPSSEGRLAAATFTPTATTVAATATATVTPIIVGMFDRTAMKIGAKSEVVRSIGKLEIAMVLDQTWSMSENNKIDRLKSDAKIFIDMMASAAARSSETNPVRISVVPFSTTVKVWAPTSLANYNTTTYSMAGLPTWLDGRARAFDYTRDLFTTESASARVDRFRLLKQMGLRWGGCVEAREMPYDIQETAPSTAGGQEATLFTPHFAPDEPDVELPGYKDSVYKKVDFGASYNDYLEDGFDKNTKTVDGDPFTWRIAQGAVEKYNTTTFRRTGEQPRTEEDYGPNGGCEMQQLNRLGTDFAAMKTSIQGMIPGGETNIPQGLRWGWHSISPNAPLKDGAAYDAKVTKIIVLMTDGDNSMKVNDADNDSYYHGYGYIWQNRLGISSGPESDRREKMNQRTAALCSNIKAKKIIIYAIGIGVSTSNRKILKACATTESAYYDVDPKAGNLDDAFLAIAESIQNLRISR